MKENELKKIRDEIAIKEEEDRKHLKEIREYELSMYGVSFEEIIYGGNCWEWNEDLDEYEIIVDIEGD